MILSYPVDDVPRGPGPAHTRLSGNKMANLQLEDKSIWDDADVSSGVCIERHRDV